MLFVSLLRRSLLLLLLLQLRKLQAIALEILCVLAHIVDVKNMRSLNVSYFTGILSGTRNNINVPTTLHRAFEEEEEDDQVDGDVVVVVRDTQQRP